MRFCDLGVFVGACCQQMPSLGPSLSTAVIISFVQVEASVYGAFASHDNYGGGLFAIMQTVPWWFEEVLQT